MIERLEPVRLAAAEGAGGAPPEAAAAAGNGGGGEGLPVDGTGYRVELANFAGPLDLLLFLIRRDEIEITDIPIAHITEQYLASIGDVEGLDLDRAGEYLLMAATLMRIKAKMLIPRDPDDEEDEDELDPRQELVRRLLEYKEFKRVAGLLGDQESEWRGVFRRAASPVPEIEDPSLPDLGVGLIDLLQAFRTVVENAVKEEPLGFEAEDFSVEEQMDFIRRECAGSAEGVSFLHLFPPAANLPLLITTFLALLEVIRHGEIIARQVERFGEIWLKEKESVEAHES